MTDAWSFVEALFAAPSLTVLVPTERHAVMASQVIVEVKASERRRRPYGQRLAEVQNRTAALRLRKSPAELREDHERS